ncbi:MAG: T9SS type A sorting domain-containing protein [Bacteroidota bacterium]
MGQSKILFIRGGAGTGGFLEGGADEQLSDITDFSTAGGNHGWGQLADTLRKNGFTLEQMIEGPASNNLPIDLANMDLGQYDVIVFGSNNAEYGQAAIDTVESYLRQGGGALFISDANWGRNWGDAPTSDQPFLDRFGWVMNQDRGTYSIANNEFLVAGHPVLTGVNAFDGEGVSPITLANGNVNGVSSTILARAKNQVRRNTMMGQGPSESPNNSDAALIVATVGQGRIAGHFDRNTFFNLNGAGTNITRFSNSTYAVNLYTWLAEPSQTTQLPGGFEPMSIQAYPNPTQGKVQLQSQEPIKELWAFDQHGRRIDMALDQTEIDLSNFPAGLYWLRVNQKWTIPIRKHNP